MRSKSVVWIPILLVGAMVYWTLAFGFGGMSLMAFALFQDGVDLGDDGAAASPKDSYQSITVNLSDLPAAAESDRPSAESEAQSGRQSDSAGITVDLVPEHEASRATPPGGQGAHGGRHASYQGPGETAF